MAAIILHHLLLILSKGRIHGARRNNKQTYVQLKFAIAVDNQARSGVTKGHCSRANLAITLAKGRWLLKEQEDSQQYISTDIAMSLSDKTEHRFTRGLLFSSGTDDANSRKIWNEDREMDQERF